MSEPRSALVTGGGSGIGRSSAIALARRGYAIAVTDVHEASAHETVSQIREFGGEAIALVLDVTSQQEIEECVAQAVRELGPLRAAVNSAGLQGELAPAGECTEENWLKIVSVNLTGTFLSMREEIRAMSSSGGSIVNIASNFGLVGQRGMPAYCASKHGVIGVSKSAALDYAALGIRINVVCPGPIETPLLSSFVGSGGADLLRGIKASVPMQRIGEPQEVGEAVGWLCDSESSYVTGAILSVDGGYVVG